MLLNEENIESIVNCTAKCTTYSLQHMDALFECAQTSFSQWPTGNADEDTDDSAAVKSAIMTQQGVTHAQLAAAALSNDPAEVSSPRHKHGQHDLQHINTLHLLVCMACSHMTCMCILHFSSSEPLQLLIVPSVHEPMLVTSTAYTSTANTSIANTSVACSSVNIMVRSG